MANSTRSGAARVACVVNSVVIQLDCTEQIQKSMSLGAYEPVQTEWVRRCLSEANRFVDVGANFGYYTTLAAQIVGATGEVFAFEPSPLAAESLAETIKANNITNVRLVRAAVGETEGTIDIFMPVNSPVHSPSAFFSDSTFEPLSVPLLALDSYAPLNDGRAIDLVKIDVEGCEPNVILGMDRLMSEGRIRNIICEFNSGWLRRNNATPKSLYDMIVERGFAVSEKTELAIHSERPGGPTFELQDIWFFRKD